MRHSNTSDLSELISINANIKPNHVEFYWRLFAEMFCSWSRNLIQNFSDNDPANIYLFKVNNRNIKKRFEICSKLATVFECFCLVLDHPLKPFNIPV